MSNYLFEYIIFFLINLLDKSYNIIMAFVARSEKKIGDFNKGGTGDSLGPGSYLGHEEKKIS